MAALTGFSDSAMLLLRLASERKLDASRGSQQRFFERGPQIIEQKGISFG
jgi:hypothetical protein